MTIEQAAKTLTRERHRDMLWRTSPEGFVVGTTEVGAVQTFLRFEAIAIAERYERQQPACAEQAEWTWTCGKCERIHPWSVGYCDSCETDPFEKANSLGVDERTAPCE